METVQPSVLEFLHLSLRETGISCDRKIAAVLIKIAQPYAEVDWSELAPWFRGTAQMCKPLCIHVRESHKTATLNIDKSPQSCDLDGTS